jgi:hypothetical protein
MHWHRELQLLRTKNVPANPNATMVFTPLGDDGFRFA